MGAHNVMKHHMDPAEVARIMAADAPPSRDQTIARLKNDIGKQKQVYEELASTFKHVTEQKDAEIAAVNDELVQTLALVDKLQHELADLMQKLAVANERRRKTDEDAEIAAVKKKLTQTLAHVDELQRDLADLRQKLALANERTREPDDKIADLKQEVKDANMQISELIAHISIKQQYEDRIKELQDEIGKLQDENGKLQAENDQQYLMIHEMEQLLNDKKDQLPLVSTCNQSETINEEVIHLTGVVENLRDKVDQLRKQLHEKEDNLRMLTDADYHHDLVTHTAMMVQEDNPYRQVLDDKIALMLWEGYHERLIHELAVGLVGVEYSEDRNKRKAWFVALMWFFGMVCFFMPYFTSGPPIADTFSMRVVMMVFKHMKHNFIVTKIYSLVNRMTGSEMVMTSLQRYIQLI